MIRSELLPFCYSGTFKKKVLKCHSSLITLNVKRKQSNIQHCCKTAKMPLNQCKLQQLSDCFVIFFQVCSHRPHQISVSTLISKFLIHANLFQVFKLTLTITIGKGLLISYLQDQSHYFYLKRQVKKYICNRYITE